MKKQEILFGSSLIIGAACLLYLEGLTLIILFENGNGNLLNVVGSILRLNPFFNAVQEVISYEFNFYVSLLMFISLISAAFLIEDLEEEENESRTNNSNRY